MSNNKNDSPRPTSFLLGLGVFSIFCGGFIIKEGKQLEGWGTIILGALSIYSALKD
jgi:hypothetical protein